MHSAAIAPGHRMRLPHVRLLLLAAVLSCAPAPAAETAPAPVPAVATPRADTAIGKEILWVRTSAEHRALLLQTYRLAGQQLERLASGEERGSWAVIIDADETLLDNSVYQLRRARQGLGFTPESWNEWVLERAAPALPGAVPFTRRVRDLGGRVAVVTNRDEVVCDATRENLTDEGIVHDIVLCMQPGGSDKNPRFEAVRQGAASPDIPPLRIVMVVGDNIRDFPSTTQEIRDRPDAAFARFGERWILLPNPMYGSWERLPMR